MISIAIFSFTFETSLFANFSLTISARANLSGSAGAAFLVSFLAGLAGASFLAAGAGFLAAGAAFLAAGFFAGAFSATFSAAFSTAFSATFSTAFTAFTASAFTSAAAFTASVFTASATGVLVPVVFVFLVAISLRSFLYLLPVGNKCAGLFPSIAYNTIYIWKKQGL